MAEAACLCLGQLRHMEVWLLSVQKGAVMMTVKIKECVCVCALHCMSEHCQSSPFYSLPLLNHFSPGEVCYRMRVMCGRGDGISQKDAKPHSLPGEGKVVAKSSLPVKKLE